MIDFDSDLTATTTMSARSRMKTMIAQIGATIHSKLMPTRSISDSTTSLALYVATVGKGGGSRWICSDEYSDDM